MSNTSQISEIKSIIKIVDTRNLSDEESEKQYNDWVVEKKTIVSQSIPRLSAKVYV